MTNSDFSCVETRVFPRFCHRVAVLQTQVLKLCTHLDLSLFRFFLRPNTCFFRIYKHVFRRRKIGRDDGKKIGLFIIRFFLRRNTFVSESRHCAAVLQTQVPKLCTDLDPGLFYILVLAFGEPRRNGIMAEVLAFGEPAQWQRFRV